MGSERDLLRELEEFNEWPPPWKPTNPGDGVVGKVLLYSEGQGRYGAVRTVILEQKDGTRVSIWLSSTVLLAEFKRLRPRVGERIAIRYCGIPEGKSYKRFRLAVDRPAEAVTFEPLGGEEDAGEDVPPVTPTPARPRPYAAATINAPRDTRRPVGTTSRGPAYDPGDPFTDPFGDE